MHEIGALTKAAELVERVAAEHGVTQVRRVTLEVDELTGYLPVSFEKYFPIVAEDKPVLRGAELDIQVVRGQALCRDCGALYNVLKQEGQCPQCASRNKEIIGDQQFVVKNIAF